MPGGDGTGPWGMGSMTGRAAGFCAGYGTPGYMNPAGGRGYGRGGRGFGWGRGGGFGRGRGGFGRGRGAGFAPMYAPPAYPAFAQPAYGAAPNPKQEVENLRNQAEYLTQALDDIQQRISELEADKQK